MAVLLVGLALTVGVSPASADVGKRDFSYGTGVTAPTGQKPQSKLWWTSGGQWWGVLWSTSSNAWTIQKYDKVARTWSNTGVKVDNRRTASPDALWDGSTLYVVMALKEGSSQTDARVLVYRFSFSGTTWSTVGSAAQVTNGKPETLVLDKDSTGKLWMTYTAANASSGKTVYVAHTTTSETTWAAPYVLPVSGASNLNSDDISTIVAYGNSMAGRYVGVLYSNQNDQTLSFARHRDGGGDAAADWQRIVLGTGAGLPDDHLHIKALMDDGSGRVFAVVKTSLNDKSPKVATDPLIVLYTINGTTSTSATAWRVGDDITRAILMLDSENKNAHLFGAGPCCSGGAIYTKSTKYDSPSFSTGLGTPFIQLATDVTINNPTSAKQTVNSTSGLLVEAGDDGTRMYVHNFLTLPKGTVVDTTPPETTITSGPSGTVASGAASFAFSSTEAGTFECRLDGAPYAVCSSPKDYTLLAQGAHTFDVRAKDAAANIDATPASRTWTITNATTLFSDDFESGTLANWQVVAGGGGTAVAQTATVKTGTYAARFSESATSESLAYARRSFATALTDFTVAGDFNVLEEGASTGNVPLLRLLDSSGARVVVAYRQNATGGQLWVTQGTTRINTTGTLPPGTWRSVELRLKIAGQASIVTVKVDGQQVYTTSTASLGTNAIKTLQLGNETAGQQGTVVVDNLSVRAGS